MSINCLECIIKKNGEGRDKSRYLISIAHVVEKYFMQEVCCKVKGHGTLVGVWKTWVHGVYNRQEHFQVIFRRCQKINQSQSSYFEPGLQYILVSTICVVRKILYGQLQNIISLQNLQLSSFQE
eukprot:TRINITY_DN2238_c0_g1_i6.p4 TRINITY_DN2238_c0_g1~~TRINITY_DN2238_c0_g1_i6.p4  ORF type:complete len:124 (-),score=2.60 TRINITY_DN2238_c0_g1_i6:23-394(-)